MPSGSSGRSDSSGVRVTGRRALLGYVRYPESAWRVDGVVVVVVAVAVAVSRAIANPGPASPNQVGEVVQGGLGPAAVVAVGVRI